MRHATFIQISGAVVCAALFGAALTIGADAVLQVLGLGAVLSAPQMLSLGGWLAGLTWLAVVSSHRILRLQERAERLENIVGTLLTMEPVLEPALRKALETLKQRAHE